MSKVPVIGKPGAGRTVAVILLGIAVLELGVSRKFGQIWALAFTGSPRNAQGQQQGDQFNPQHLPAPPGEHFGPPPAM